MVTKDASEAGRALARKRWNPTEAERRAKRLARIEDELRELKPVTEAEARQVRAYLPPVR